MQNNVISPDITANSFVSKSGKEYIIYPSLTTERFRVFEQMQIEMQYGVSLSAFKFEVQQAYEKLNAQKTADAAVMLHNAMNGLTRIETGGPHPLLMICALFICPAEEDQSRWNDAEAQAKIEDWANVDVAFFFALARRLYTRFIPASDFDSRIILEMGSDPDDQTTTG